MTKLVRDDAGGKATRVTDLVQVIAELTDECFFRARTGQEPSIGRQRIKRTKELEASDKLTHKRIHGDHTFCFELSEWHVNGPLIRAGRAQAVAGQIDTFTDAHTGMANQQKSIATQIVAAEEFLLQEFILFCRERTWEPLREARNVLATDQMGKFGELFGPSELVEDAAQSDKQIDTGCGREWRCLRTQTGHPAEDVRFTAQLVQGLHRGMSSAEIAQEVASSPTIVTSRFGTECHDEGIDCAVEERNQRMLKRRASRAAHEAVTGKGRMCCATARAYCR